MYTAKSNRASKEKELETRVQLIETRLRQKLEVTTGFADLELRRKKLYEIFSAFDTDNSGEVSYEEFFAAMTKLNFIGVQRELEAVFNCPVI